MLLRKNSTISVYICLSGKPECKHNQGSDSISHMVRKAKKRASGKHHARIFYQLPLSILTLNFLLPRHMLWDIRHHEVG